jgi:hypothetical protein
MAGSATTTLTFSTDVGGGVTEDSETVNFQHTNPVVFNVTPSPAVGTDIGTSATNIVLTATNVNIPWWGRRGTDAANNIPTTVNPFDTPQSSDAITVPIPARVWTDASSWTGEILVQAGYDAYNGVSAINTPQSFTFDRDPYTITVTGLATEIANTVTSLTPTVTTDAPGFRILFKAAGTSGADVEVIDNSVNSPATPTITITANDTYTARTIKVVNYYDQTQELASFVQKARPINLALVGSYSTVPQWSVACPTDYRQALLSDVATINSGYSELKLYNTSGTYTGYAANGSHYEFLLRTTATSNDGYNSSISCIGANGLANGIAGTGASFLPGSQPLEMKTWYKMCIAN